MTPAEQREAIERLGVAGPVCTVEFGGGLIAAWPSGPEIRTQRYEQGAWRDAETVTARLARRAGESWLDPQLAMGPDGTPWLVYRSNLRHMTYHHRWLGDGWGPRQDGWALHHVEPDCANVYEANSLPIAACELGGEPGRPQLTLSSGGYPFIRRTFELAAPVLRAACGRGELFLDTQAVAATDNLAWATAPADKHTANPIMRPTFQPGTPDEIMVMNHGTVLHEHGMFRMWYTGVEVPGHGPVPKGENWDRYGYVCYAESDDGLAWRRPSLGLVEYLGRRDNHLVPNLWLQPLIVRDDRDPDPARRYKCFEQTCDAIPYPGRGQLHTSPDGLHWQTEEAPRRYPGTRPWWFPWFSAFDDPDEPDPARRWKAYGCFATGPRYRRSGVAFSPDAVHWTGHPDNPILYPLQGLAAGCHDLVVWKELGLYVGLLQVRGEPNADYEFELVVSRDGVRFSRVSDGEAFLRRGTAGAWDHGLLTVFSRPVFVGDQTWFYYGACRKTHATQPSGTEDEEHTCGGIAHIRTGRYAGFSPCDASRPAGLLTAPIETADTVLCLNARCGPGGSIRVEVQRAAGGATLDGYRLADAVPVTGDGTALPCRWAGRTALATSAPVRLRFEILGPVTIYGFHWQ